MNTHHAQIVGRSNVWEIEYVHGNENTSGHGLHILRVHGDITSPELHQAVERWKDEQRLDGVLVWHFP